MFKDETSKSISRSCFRYLICILLVSFLFIVFPAISFAVGSYGVNENSAAYTSGGGNPYAYPQCTWYCWGRALEKCGVTLPGLGNANMWYDRALAAGLNADTVPSENSIAVFRGDGTGNSTYGHVAFVEKIVGTTVYLSESNSSQSNLWGLYIEATYNANHPIRYEGNSVWQETLIGYIHLGSTAPVNHSPTGYLDESSGGFGTISLRGWAKDEDALDQSLAIHVYVGGEAGTGASCYVISANKSRPDVGGNYGYDETIEVQEIGTKQIHVYAINTPEGENKLIGTSTIFIEPKDYVSWSLEENGLLKVYGRGDLVRYILPDEYVDRVKTIEIGNGITSIGSFVFEDYDELISVTIPGNVTTIGVAAFQNCDKLESVNLSEGLETISNQAFFACKSLQHMVLPDSVTSIGTFAFHSAGLKSIQMSENLTTINPYAFYGCAALESVSIPSGVTNIDEHAFSYCSQLATVYLSDGIVSLGDGVFSRCYKLDHVVIPDTVTSIGKFAFSECFGLTDIQLPSGISCLEEGILSYCINLPAVSIPANVTIIKDRVFEDCRNLAEILFPDYISSFGTSRVFDYCPAICYANLGSETAKALSAFRAFRVPGNHYDLRYNDFVNYQTFELSNVDKDITSFSIPNNVTSIAASAFENCTELKNITIPNSVHSIGEKAFYGCSNLKWISFPDNISTISWSITQGSSCILYAKLNSITAKSLGKVRKSFRVPGTKYDLMYLYDGDTELGLKISDVDTDLTSIDIPDEVTAIGTEAFARCSQLENITIPDNVSEIGFYAFNKCTSLQNISISSGLDIIPEGMCSGCTNLRQITIPGQVKVVGNHAFDGCSGITEVTFSNVNTIGEGAFYGCSSLEEIHLPDSVVTIGERAFQDCSGITAIHIGKGIRTIPTHTFAFCNNLQTIYLSASLRLIEENAFASCVQIADVYYDGSVSDSISLNWDDSYGLNAQWHYSGDPLLSNFIPPQELQVISLDEYRALANQGIRSIQFGMFYTNGGKGGDVVYDNRNYPEILTVLYNLDQSIQSVTMKYIVSDSKWYEAGYDQFGRIGQKSITEMISNGGRYILGIDPLQDWNKVHVYGEQIYFNNGTSYQHSIYNDEYIKFINGSIYTINPFEFENVRNGGEPDYEIPGTITLPSSLTAIESEAFAGLPLSTRIVIPNTVTNIAPDAFDNRVVIVCESGSQAYTICNQMGWTVVTSISGQ